MRLTSPLPASNVITRTNIEIMSTIHESIVLVGGGGGVYRVARFLKRKRLNITTVQTMFDSGGHSRQLRDERGMLPPGDIRQAILALSDDTLEESLRVLLSYRFPARNHSAIDHATSGNFMLTALTEHHNGNIVAAINDLCRLFRVKGRVLPVSLDHANLSVTLSDGSTLTGEGVIDKRRLDDDRTIVSARLKPAAHIYTGAYQALVKADKVVFCPGDLYTSIIPNALVDGFREAMAETEARLIFAVNIMTKKSETHGYSASRFATTLLSYLGRERFDTVIVNGQPIRPKVQAAYRLEQAYPVRVDMAHLRRSAEQVLVEDLADQTGGVIRHSEHIAGVIAGI